MSIFTEDEAVRNDVLKHFDFAFDINWNKEQHKKIHTYLTSLTMYFGMKFNGHFASAGSYLAYKFNEAGDKEEGLQKIRMLIRNESRETFIEEVVNGCSIFKI